MHREDLQPTSPTKSLKHANLTTLPCLLPPRLEVATNSVVWLQDASGNVVCVQIAPWQLQHPPPLIFMLLRTAWPSWNQDLWAYRDAVTQMSNWMDWKYTEYIGCLHSRLFIRSVYWNGFPSSYCIIYFGRQYISLPTALNLFQNILAAWMQPCKYVSEDINRSYELGRGWRGNSVSENKIYLVLVHPLRWR